MIKFDKKITSGADPTPKNRGSRAKVSVLWINYHASRTPSASSSDMQYMAKKLLGIFKGLKNPRQNLYVLTPLVIPLPGSWLVKRLNQLLLIAQIRLALKKIGKGPLQVWSFTPEIAYALGHFNEEKVVYYCVDDHVSFSGYDKAQVLRDEKELCEKSDLVITTSMALQEAKKAWNPNTVLVPHGVDFDHFNRAVTQDLPCPKELESIPHPRLEFFGLSPFKVNELTHAVNPIKLREYLLDGLPVISTPMPEVRLYDRLVKIVKNRDEFEKAFEKCFFKSREDRTSSIIAMSEETWHKKMDLICGSEI